MLEVRFRKMKLSQSMCSESQAETLDIDSARVIGADMVVEAPLAGALEGECPRRIWINRTLRIEGGIDCVGGMLVGSRPELVGPRCRENDDCALVYCNVARREAFVGKYDRNFLQTAQIYKLSA